MFIAPFVVGCVLIIALGFYEAYVAKSPLLHPYLFKRIRTFLVMNITAFVGGMLFYGLQAFLPTYLSAIYNGADGIRTGVDGIPFGLGTNVGGVGSAILLPILGPMIGTRWLLTIGVALQSLFIPLMAVPGINDKPMALAFSFFAAIGRFFVRPKLPHARACSNKIIGVGVMELLTLLLVQLSSPDEWLGFSTGTIGLARCMGGSIGTAIYTTILQTKLATKIPEMVAGAALAAGLPSTSLPGLLGALTGVPGSPALADVPGATLSVVTAASTALKEAYVASFRYVWYTAIPFGVVALACAASSKDVRPLNMPCFVTFEPNLRVLAVVTSHPEGCSTLEE